MEGTHIPRLFSRAGIILFFRLYQLDLDRRYHLEIMRHALPS